VQPSARKREEQKSSGKGNAKLGLRWGVDPGELRGYRGKKGGVERKRANSMKNLEKKKRDAKNRVALLVR